MVSKPTICSVESYSRLIAGDLPVSNIAGWLERNRKEDFNNENFKTKVCSHPQKNCCLYYCFWGEYGS